MTNIIQKKVKKDVHSHIDKAYSKIDGALPPNYVDRVFLKIKNEPKLTSGIIRNIKNRVSDYPLSRISVLNVLVEIAKEYQNELKILENLTK